jgi:oligopeptide/dipeptide ABC transporter ATP-binding protein
MCDRIAVMYAGQIVELADVRKLLTEPRHPYTISLLRSLPDAERKSRYLVSIPGTPPRLVDVKPGCRFAERCPLATPETRTWQTELLAVDDEHLVRCLRHDDARRPEAWPMPSYELE